MKMIKIFLAVSIVLISSCIDDEISKDQISEMTDRLIEQAKEEVKTEELINRKIE